MAPSSGQGQRTSGHTALRGDAGWSLPTAHLLVRSPGEQLSKAASSLSETNLKSGRRPGPDGDLPGSPSEGRREETVPNLGSPRCALLGRARWVSVRALGAKTVAAAGPEAHGHQGQCQRPTPLLRGWAACTHSHLSSGIHARSLEALS